MTSHTVNVLLPPVAIAVCSLFQLFGMPRFMTVLGNTFSTNTAENDTFAEGDEEEYAISLRKWLVSCRYRSLKAGLGVSRVSIDCWAKGLPLRIPLKDIQPTLFDSIRALNEFSQCKISHAQLQGVLE